MMRVRAQGQQKSRGVDIAQSQAVMGLRQLQVKGTYDAWQHRQQIPDPEALPSLMRGAQAGKEWGQQKQRSCPE